MTEAARSLSPPEPEPPVYVGSSQKPEVFAHFGSGLIVRASRGRARAYPGLRGAAPPTGAFYEAVAEMSGGRSVIDAGSGAGTGTRILCNSFEHVAAVEMDAEAVVFCREYAPAAHTVQADLEGALDVERADALIVADVLGHLRHPSRALTRLRDQLTPSGKALVAEPAASVLQRLVAPARRAYSTRQLARTLVRGGFVPERWLCETGSFVGCVARPAHDASVDALLEALNAVEQKDTDAARTALAHAARSERRGVAVEAACLRATTALMERDGDAAVRAYSTALELDPENPAALAGLAEVLLLTGDFSGALSLALRAASTDPTEPLAARVAAQAATELRHHEALSAWRLAVNLMPDEFGAVGELSRLSAERGDYAMGIAAFERLRAYEQQPGVAFHLTLGWLLVAEGRFADAGIEARIASALAPDDPDVQELAKTAGS